MAIGQVFEDGGDGVGQGVLGQPDPGGEAAAVAEGYPGVRDLADGTGQVRDVAQRRVSTKDGRSPNGFAGGRKGAL